MHDLWAEVARMRATVAAATVEAITDPGRVIAELSTLDRDMLLHLAARHVRAEADRVVCAHGHDHGAAAAYAVLRWHRLFRTALDLAAEVPDYPPAHWFAPDTANQPDPPPGGPTINNRGDTP